MLLSEAGLNTVKAKDKEVKKFDEANYVTLKIDEKSPLNKVGGTYTFDYKGEKVIVLRKSESEFSAFSAICPHKGGPIKYNEKTQQFFCPWHNSQFGLDGQRISGPAQQPLTAYGAQDAVVVSLKV